MHPHLQQPSTRSLMLLSLTCCACSSGEVLNEAESNEQPVDARLVLPSSLRMSERLTLSTRPGSTITPLRLRLTPDRRADYPPYLNHPAFTWQDLPAQELVADEDGRVHVDLGRYKELLPHVTGATLIYKHRPPWHPSSTTRTSSVKLDFSAKTTLHMPTLSAPQQERPRAEDPVTCKVDGLGKRREVYVVQGDGTSAVDLLGAPLIRVKIDGVETAKPAAYKPPQRFGASPGYVSPYTHVAHLQLPTTQAKTLEALRSTPLSALEEQVRVKRTITADFIPQLGPLTFTISCPPARLKLAETMLKRVQSGQGITRSPRPTQPRTLIALESARLSGVFGDLSLPLSELDRVAVIKRTTHAAGSCRYRRGSLPVTLQRHRESIEVTVYDARTGAQLNQKTLGSVLERCPLGFDPRYSDPMNARVPIKTLQEHLSAQVTAQYGGKRR